MKYIIILLLSLSCFASEIGLKAGEKVPNLALKSITGKEYQLDNLDKKTALIFYRGSWCPYCIKQLKSVQSEVMSKTDKNSQILVISVDRAAVAKKMKDKNKFTFDVISDPKAQSLLAFNIVNKIDDELVKKYKQSYQIDVEADSGETHHMVAHPAVFVIDGDKITYSDIHINYKDRTKNEEIIKALSSN
ncbi:peroxiredoxin family protein [Halobacteriovorax sp.]|uniref:peroxiredoxin family protein n=1 Tax=Halobacteriovorax sp. TaxID=2020862 RepID=UPI003AF2B468